MRIKGACMLLPLRKLQLHPSSSFVSTAVTENLASASPGVQLVAVRASGVRESEGAGFPGHSWFPGQSYPAARSRPATRKETSSGRPFGPPYSHQVSWLDEFWIFPLQTHDDSTHATKFIAVQAIDGKGEVNIVNIFLVFAGNRDDIE